MKSNHLSYGVCLLSWLRLSLQMNFNRQHQSIQCFSLQGTAFALTSLGVSLYQRDYLLRLHGGANAPGRHLTLVDWRMEDGGSRWVKCCWREAMWQRFQAFRWHFCRSQKEILFEEIWTDNPWGWSIRSNSGSTSKQPKDENRGFLPPRHTYAML